MRSYQGMLAAAALAALMGCAGNKPVQSPIADKAPDWVNRGNGAFKATEGSGVFYGVGIAPKMADRYLNVKLSDERARAEIASVLNTYVKSLTKSYTASTSSGESSVEEQHVSTTMKSLAEFTLHGATIIEHWKDPSDGTLFALCKLDMGTFKKTLDDAKELDTKVRDYVRANADKAFDELEKAKP